MSMTTAMPASSATALIAALTASIAGCAAVAMSAW
jgi:hypothetical protein